MATKKPKKLRNDQVRRDLELLFCGAGSGRYDDNEYADLVSQLGAECFGDFTLAVRAWFFLSDWGDANGLFDIWNCDTYRTLDTLAERIVNERFRLDKLNAEGGSDGE